MNTSLPTNMTSLDLSATAKKHFCIDNNPDRSFDLNTSDLLVISRLNEGTAKLNDLELRAQALLDGVDIDDEDNVLNEVKLVGERLKAVDDEMRSIIDYIFDAPVSAACAPYGSMFDPIGGRFRFEFVIEVLVNQYSATVSEEYKKMEARLKSHTGKYTKKG